MNRLKEMREVRGYTLDDVEGLMGIKRGTYSNYENGNTEPKLKTWQKLADFYGVSVPYLQGRYDHLTKKEALRVIHEVMTVCGISKEELKERL
ncbi:helix-turn-helix domain-containing protein [Lactobacillus crispatus]|uniref:helix-turn-helix domain-containing protein n=1 Tax=Lactobacillus crispatus TaxID=47770 RepID=UPI001F0955AC|nr:helix-turn-helix transcriptional regulator [Lactobacillus crispatus]MCT7687727.1 helix-turn-helix domain-containing protein [Lactobacillus crispatus]MCT7712838.1 helix-turn-helix domain-containing protein [Lactobacillus crispatus]MCT7888357.1 helix-turn-helix domain-containing protein [Lactobacillus crispatus]MDK6435580.1 helix-turn-helix transcriptional regulator [Lactobacillus crispatus]